MKPVLTWVLIADGGHAKVLETDGTRSGLKAQADMAMSVDLPRTHDIVSDRGGRNYESQGNTRHATGDSFDPHRELKRAFARKVGKALEGKLAAGRFDRLVVVAPPPALGDLRAALPKKVRAKVVAEIAHDLVKTPHNRIWPHLETVLGKEVARTERPRAAATSKTRKRSAK